MHNFDELIYQFNKLQAAFETASKERADIAINVLPDLFGVAELTVYHNIKRKLFFKDIKKQCFFLCITKYETLDETHGLYEYETTSIDEVKSIFRDLINNHAIPILNTWKLYDIKPLKWLTFLFNDSNIMILTN